MLEVSVLAENARHQGQRLESCQTALSKLYELISQKPSGSGPSASSTSEGTTASAAPAQPTTGDRSNSTLQPGSSISLTPGEAGTPSTKSGASSPPDSSGSVLGDSGDRQQTDPGTKPPSAEPAGSGGSVCEHPIERRYQPMNPEFPWFDWCEVCGAFQRLRPRLILLLYEAWSEEFYSAGFMTPDKDHVTSFRQWLKKEIPTPETFDYEREMLETWLQLEQADISAALAAEPPAEGVPPS